MSALFRLTNRAIIQRGLTVKPSFCLARNTKTSPEINNRSFSKDSASSSDDEGPKKSVAEKADKKPKKPKSTEPTKESPATARLNQLLASMKAENNLTLTKQVSMAQPGEAQKKRREAAKQNEASKDVVAAAKRVAALLGEENKKQTESELLAKLLGHNKAEENVSKDSEATTSNEPNEQSLSELIVGMKIDRSPPTPELTRSEYVRRTLSSRNQQQQWQQRPTDERTTEQRKQRKRDPEAYTGSVNLFGSEPLGIFKNVEALAESPDMLRTWAHLQRRELKLQVTHPPANYFEKIALWTEQGKVWRFPIDNEQDMNEEVNVDFSEHIFLDQHLEAWCPDKGPIRHFMELVCVGLSKNPYITAQEKKDHIFWYRDYFEAKKEVLKELMHPPKLQVTAASQAVKDH